MASTFIAITLKFIPTACVYFFNFLSLHDLLASRVNYCYNVSGSADNLKGKNNVFNTKRLIKSAPRAETTRLHPTIAVWRGSLFIEGRPVFSVIKRKCSQSPNYKFKHAVISTNHVAAAAIHHAFSVRGAHERKNDKKVCRRWGRRERKREMRKRFAQSCAAVKDVIVR
jgi:hypothetical protein